MPPLMAVIVCYHPDWQAVESLARRVLASPGVDVLMVDNSDGAPAVGAAKHAVGNLPITTIVPGANVGLGAAHNLGIREARRRGCAMVLLLDQDSQIDADAIGALRSAYLALRAKGVQVAAVGPTFVDPRDGYVYPFVSMRGLRSVALRPGKGDVAECDLLISSGSLIALEAVDAVGELDESLFIDYVDIEWCLRARSAGWKVFGVGGARMTHAIGESTLTVLGYRLPLHPPPRQYFLVRNAVLLLARAGVPWPWRIRLAYRVCGQLAVFPFLCPPRAKRARWMLRGLVDGLCSRGGPLPGSHSAASHEIPAESASRALPERGDDPGSRASRPSRG